MDEEPCPVEEGTVAIKPQLFSLREEADTGFLPRDESDEMPVTILDPRLPAET